MKKRAWISWLLSAALLAGCGASLSLPAAAEEQTATPLKAVYSAPARNSDNDTDSNENPDWQEEGSPIGNGFIGGMVYGGVEDDRILINEKTVWSGGPGASANYDGGIDNSLTKARMHENLQKLRRRLQDMVNDFTENKSAYLDGGGNLITQDYGVRRGDVWEDAETEALINSLRGEKDQFGSYQMLSDLHILDRTTGSYSDYRRELDLRTGTATVSYVKGRVTYYKEYFVNNPSNVLVIRLSADKQGKLNRTVQITSNQSKKTVSGAEGVITMVGQPADQRANGLHFAQVVKVIPKGGAMNTTAAGAVTVTDADEILIILSAGTDYRQCMDDSFNYFTGEDPLPAAEARVNAAAEKGWDALLAEHLADYGELFGRVEFALDGVAFPEKDTASLLKGYADGSNTWAEDRYLEMLYYQFGRYLLISSSREGSLPANLQGIWAATLSPPWSADYHTNINVQMNYWLAEQTNLSECHLPVIEYTNSLVPRGTLTAQYYYCTQDGGDVRGWTIGHENNPWGNTAPGNWYWGYYFPAAAAWMCQDIWEHYAFTLDEAFLAANFDTMLQAALFWVDNLWVDERDGTLVANPSYSPEHGPYSLGSSCDQEIIWELFEEIRKAAAVLGIDTAEIREVASAQANLYLPRIGLGGEYLEWKDETTMDVTGDGGHRHVNHLYSLHPGTLVVAGRSEEDDKIVEAMKKVLRTRGDGGTGWSKAWKINFWARLRDGEHAALMLGEQLKNSTLQNLFDTHPPFQIDGNFGATAGMTEMLIQSQGDTIDLMAAMPYDWGRGGSVTGLKARGNFTVDMTWKDQQLQGARITSGAGADCVLNYHNLSKAAVTRVSDGTAAEITVLDAHTVSFATEAGESYEITGIPQDKKFAKQVNLWKATFNNLYSEALMKASGCPDDNGAYLESIEPNSPAPKMGLKAGDVIRAFNGEPVLNGDDLLARYEGMEDNETAALTVWRGTGTFETVFAKTAPFSNYSDVFLSMPAQLWAGGYYSLTGETGTAEEEGFTCLREGGAQYMYCIFFANPTSARAEVKASGNGTVTLRLNGRRGDILAEFKVTDTGGEFRTFSAPVQNAASCEDDEGMHDLYLAVEGDLEVKWVMLDCGGLTGDVDADGQITSTDARMALQRSVGKLTDGDLPDASAADVDADGQITSTDARMILQYSVGKIDGWN